LGTALRVTPCPEAVSLYIKTKASPFFNVAR